jgi:hydrogenase-4 component E
VPVAFSTLACGLFLVVARKKALTQALGYLIFENGIFTFGLAVLPEAPLAIEVGILLDALVAILVMGITIFHINRAFDSISTERLTALKD